MHEDDDISSIDYNHIIQAPADAQVPELKNLRLIECRDFHELGLQLELKPHSLETLKRDNQGDTVGFARGMFSRWLNGLGSKPTYKNLILALRKVKEDVEAKKLCDKYGKFSYVYTCIPAC